jgi:DNA-binding LacI/PurR family transcriptional regulator
VKEILLKGVGLSLMGTSGAYANVAKRIQNDYLDSGKYAVGSKLPTVSQLSRHYEVSAPTIRKAAKVLVDRGWLAKHQGSGIYIDVLPEHSHTSIGFISTDFRSPLDSNVLQGIARVVDRSNKYNLMVAPTRNDVAEERRQVETMRKRGIKGVIVYSISAHGRDSQEDYLAREFRDYPIVVVDIYSQKMNRPHVIMDNYYAGYEMTQYLLAQRCRHIAFIKFARVFHRGVEDRFMGYKNALEKANIPLVPEHIASCDITHSDTNTMQTIIKQLISTKPRPDAIISLADGLVPFTINYLRSCGLAVPQDIIVSGFDNLHSNLTADIWPTTRPDFVQMGEQAAEILLKGIESGNLTSSGVVLRCPLLLPEEQKSESMFYKREKLTGFDSVVVEN